MKEPDGWAVVSDQGRALLMTSTKSVAESWRQVHGPEIVRPVYVEPPRDRMILNVLLAMPHLSEQMVRDVLKAAFDA